MPDDAFLLSGESAEWLRRKRAEGDAPPGPARPDAAPPGGRTALVRCGTLIAGSSPPAYLGRLVERRSPAAAWTNAGSADVALLHRGGAALVPGVVYLAHGSGFRDGRPAYWAGDGGGSDSQITVVTNVCPTRNASGVVTGLTVERRTLTLPADAVIGPAVCEADPADCCPTASLPCTPCPGESVPLPRRFCFLITNKTGSAAGCVPDAGYFTPEPSLSAFGLVYGREGVAYPANMSWPYPCGSLFFTLRFGCTAGPTPISLLVAMYPNGGPAGPLLAESPSGNLYQFACDTFAAASGSVPLGTFSSLEGAAGSYDVTLAWGADCGPTSPPPPLPACLAAADRPCLTITYGTTTITLQATGGSSSGGVTTWTGTSSPAGPCGLTSWSVECSAAGVVTVVGTNAGAGVVLSGTLTMIAPALWSGPPTVGCSVGGEPITQITWGWCPPEFGGGIGDA